MPRLRCVFRRRLRPEDASPGHLFRTAIRENAKVRDRRFSADRPGSPRPFLARIGAAGREPYTFWGMLHERTGCRKQDRQSQKGNRILGPDAPGGDRCERLGLADTTGRAHHRRGTGACGPGTADAGNLNPLLALPRKSPPCMMPPSPGPKPLLQAQRTIPPHSPNALRAGRVDVPHAARHVPRPWPERPGRCAREWRAAATAL